MSLHHIDKQLLDIIQTDFPLTSRPYANLGARLGLTEAETLARVRALRGQKILRRLGANFDSKTLGFRSTLCAAKVPEDKMEHFCAMVNASPNVTHNYLRAHAYNVWFTYIGESWDHVCTALADMERQSGISILNLPATKLFKIRVNFQMA